MFAPIGCGTVSAPEVGGDVGPQGPEGDGRRRVPGVGRHRQALRPHPFERARVRDRRREERRVVAVQRLDERPVHRLAPIEHRHERSHPRRVVEAGEEGAELGERAHRQRARDGRHGQLVRRHEHRLARQRDARWAVEDRHVVAVVLGGEQPAQAVGRVLGAVELEIEVAQREVGRHQVHAGHVGLAYVAGQLAALGDQPPGAALEPLLDPEGEGRRALRIEVPQQDAPTAAGRFGGEVDGGGGLADTTLDAVERQHLHGAGRSLSSRSSRARRVGALSKSSNRSPTSRRIA